MDLSLTCSEFLALFFPKENFIMRLNDRLNSQNFKLQQLGCNLCHEWNEALSNMGIPVRHRSKAEKTLRELTMWRRIWKCSLWSIKFLCVWYNTFNFIWKSKWKGFLYNHFDETKQFHKARISLQNFKYPLIFWDGSCLRYK